MLHFTGADGNRIDSADMEGMPPGIPNGVPHEITFRRFEGDRTELTVQEFGYTNAGGARHLEGGVDQVPKNLGQHLEEC